MVRQKQNIFFNALIFEFLQTSIKFFLQTEVNRKAKLNIWQSLQYFDSFIIFFLFLPEFALFVRLSFCTENSALCAKSNVKYLHKPLFPIPQHFQCAKQWVIGERRIANVSFS